MKIQVLSTIANALFLVGCASSAPAPVSSVSSPNSSMVGSEGPPPPEPAYSPAPSRVQVQEPRTVEEHQNPALNQLLDQSLQFIYSGDFARAISTAERAMSIDRYDPRVYLMLAQAHRYSGNLALSRQYAERGLAVAQPGSSTAYALENLR